MNKHVEYLRDLASGAATFDAHKLQAAANALEHENISLRALLLEYGNHHADCDLRKKKLRRVENCTCGYDAQTLALTASDDATPTPEQEAEQRQRVLDHAAEFRDTGGGHGQIRVKP